MFVHSKLSRFSALAIFVRRAVSLLELEQETSGNYFIICVGAVFFACVGVSAQCAVPMRKLTVTNENKWLKIKIRRAVAIAKFVRSVRKHQKYLS